jgi:hypothetical protein
MANYNLVVNSRF